MGLGFGLGQDLGLSLDMGIGQSLEFGVGHGVGLEQEENDEKANTHTSNRICQEY